MSSSSPKINTTAAPLATAAKPGSSPTSPLSKEHLEGDALISALKQQLEFYFSKQNLATDAYLLSHMNASKFVPIDVIANFRKVKMLTEDRALLVDVMKQCRNLVVDETGTNVRPNIKMERTTLILRDIPASTPIDEIKSIFASPSAPAKPINVRSDIDDTWFVTFESEDACTDTALWLPSQTFQGKSVKCRVKSENLLRGFYYPNAPKETPPITVTAPIPMQASSSPTTQWRTTGSAPYYGNGYMPYAGYPYGYPPAAGYVQPTGQTPPQTNTRLDGKNERRQKNTNNGAPAQPNTRKRGKGADAAAAAGSVQVVAAASGAVTVTGVVSPTAATPAAAAVAAPAPGQGKKALKRAKKAAAAQAAAAAAAAATPAATTAATKATPDGVPLGLDNFPALPNNPVKKASPVSGYTSTFHEYDREAMAAIVAALCKQSYPRPDTFPTDPDSAIVRKTVLTTCQLMEPFPVIYPASPSPELAAQPTHSGLAMPFLDLGVGPASAVVAGRNPYIDAHPKKKAAPTNTAQPKKKAAPTNATTAANTNTPTASTSTTSTPAPAANGKPKSATKASKPKYQKANTSASSSSTSTSTSTAASTSTSSTPTPAPSTPAVPVVTAASIVAANANLPVQPNPKQVAAAKKAAEEKAAREREAREKAAAAEAAKTLTKGSKPKYQPKGTKQAGQKDKEKEKEKDKDKENQVKQGGGENKNNNNETKSNEPPKIKWAAKVGSVDPAVALAKIAKAKAEAEQKTKAEATSSNSNSSSSSSSSTSTAASSTSTSTSSTSTSSHTKDHSSKDKESSHSSKDASSAASPTASDDEANKKLSYAEMARRAKNAAAAAAAAAAKSNGTDATPTSPTSSRINHSSSPASPSPSPSPSSQ